MERNVETIRRELGFKLVLPFNSSASLENKQEDDRYIVRCLLENVPLRAAAAVQLVDETALCAVLIAIAMKKAHVGKYNVAKEDGSMRETRTNDRNLFGCFIQETLSWWKNDNEEHCKNEVHSSPVSGEEAIESSIGIQHSADSLLLENLSLLYSDIYVLDGSKLEPDSSLATFLKDEPAPQKHMNWLPLYNIVARSERFYLILGSTPHSLDSLIKFNYQTLRPSSIPSKSPPKIGEVRVADCDSTSDCLLRFVIFQLIHAVSFLHNRGQTHGSIQPSQVHIQQDLWVLLPPPITFFPASKPCLKYNRYSKTEDTDIESEEKAFDDIAHIHGLTEKWRRLEISNLEYLMAVNAAAGRTMADATFHPVIPWITDFSSEMLDDENASHWRDLTKSKYRLAKGDDQLDITFDNSPTPHHITESLSEITFYIYLARVTPLSTLKNVVRSNFEAKEYPASMQRMYEWTPDESIPEFFQDPSVFKSKHKTLDMPDLKLPPWCADEQEFIDWHRRALESPYVSRNLHHWIDLNFGYKLSGPAAELSKNVTLPISSLPGSRTSKSPGFVQIFTDPHPPRFNDSDSLEIFTADKFQQNYSFDTKYSHVLQPIYMSPRLTGKQSDAFALGCVIAEMYLREPLFSQHSLQAYCNGASLEESVPHTMRLPRSIRHLVVQLTKPSCELSLEECLFANDLFPSFFVLVHEFLCGFQRERTWIGRLNFTKQTLPACLEAVDPVHRFMAVQIIKPSLLEMVSMGCENTKAQAPIQLLVLLGPFVEVNREFLPLVVHIYEQHQSRDQWQSVSYAMQPEIVLRAWKSCGTKAFVRYFLPLLLDTLFSLSASKQIKDEAAHSLLALSQDGGLGPGLSINLILEPVLKRWVSMKARCYPACKITFGDSHTSFLCVQSQLNDGVKLRIPRIAAFVDKIRVGFQSASKDRSPVLLLPMESPMIKLVRYLGASVGRLTIVERIFPRAIAVLKQVLSQNMTQREALVALDCVSLLVSMFRLVSDTDVAENFFNQGSGMKEFSILNILLQTKDIQVKSSDGESLQVYSDLILLYVASLVSVLTHRLASGKQIGYLLDPLSPFFVEVDNMDASSSSSVALWVARILFLPFQTHIGVDRVRAAFDTLGGPQSLERVLVPPFTREQDRVEREFDMDECCDDEVFSLDESMLSSGDTDNIGKGVKNSPVPRFVGAGGTSNFESEEEKDSELVVFEFLSRTNAPNNGGASVESPIKKLSKQESGEFGESQPSSSGGRKEQSHQIQDGDRLFPASDIAAERAWHLGSIANGGKDQMSQDEPSFRRRLAHSVKAHTSPIVTMEVSPDETLLSTSCRSNVIRLWNLNGPGPKQLCELQNKSRHVVGTKLISSGSKCIILDGGLRIWDTVKQEVSTLPMDLAHRPVLAIEAASGQPQGEDTVFYTSTVGGTVDVIDLRVKLGVVASHLLPYSSIPNSRREYDPRGIMAGSLASGGTIMNGWVAAARPSGFVTILDPRTGGVLLDWKAHESGVVRLFSLNDISNNLALQISTASRQMNLISLSADGSARLWGLDAYDSVEGSLRQYDGKLSHRPTCKMRVKGFPSAVRFSKIPAPDRSFSLFGKLSQSLEWSLPSELDDQNLLKPFVFQETAFPSTPSRRPREFTNADLAEAAAAKSISSGRLRSISADDLSSAAGSQDTIGGPQPLLRRNDSLFGDELVEELSNGELAVGRRSPSLEELSERDSTRVLKAVELPNERLYPVSSSPSLVQSQSIGLSRIPSLSMTSASSQFPDIGIYTAPAKPTSSKRSFLLKSGRIQVSIPYCGTADFCGQNLMDSSVVLAMGVDNRLAYGTFDLNARGSDTTARLVQIEDRESREIPFEKLKINVFRSLPTRGLSLIGAESGDLHCLI